MNFLLLIGIALVIWRGIRGMKIGLVDEVGRLVALVLSLFVLSLGILLYTSVKTEDTKNIVLSVVMMLVTGIVWRIMKLVIDSLSAVAHLPLLNMLNSLLGIAVGVAEVVVVFWILYVLTANFDLGSFGRQIMDWTRQSEILQKIYDMNRIAYWMANGKIVTVQPPMAAV